MTVGAEDRAKAASRPDDVIAAVLLDHAEIKELFAETKAATTVTARKDAFSRLVSKLAVHETAEEELVHPLSRRAQDGDAVVDARLEEEQQGKQLLADLEKMGVEHPDFTTKLAQLESEVKAHAEHEEREEHPRLERAVDEERLRQLKSLFRAAERTAPTHPHPKGPGSATGNVLVGPMVSVIDRTRDAIRKAMSSS